MLIEERGSGTALLQDISYNDIRSVREIFPVEPVGDKAMRMSAQSAGIEAGRVYIPEWIVRIRAAPPVFAGAASRDAALSV